MGQKISKALEALGIKKDPVLYYAERPSWRSEEGNVSPEWRSMPSNGNLNNLIFKRDKKAILEIDQNVTFDKKTKRTTIVLK